MNAKFAIACAGLALSTAPTTLMAKPVYLACKYLVDGKPQEHAITVNEETATVSIFVATSGYSRTMKATFTPDRVTFTEPPFRFAIDRTTLAMTRDIPGLSGAPETGRCEIVAPPERKF